MNKQVYYERPEWSFSQMSKIISGGIDYAVACKRGLITQPETAAFKLGRLVHDDALCQGEEHWVLKAYPDFRTKEAKDWRDAQTLPIVDEYEFNNIAAALEQIKTHPLYEELLVGEGIENEVELYAKINDVEIRGKADAVKTLENGMKVITDLKTTSKFEDWQPDYRGYAKTYKAFQLNYDMQGATYSILASDEYDYYIFVAEIVKPYRTAVFHAAPSFLENGMSKLATAIEEIKKSNDRELDFHQNLTLADTTELGDMSL